LPVQCEKLFENQKTGAAVEHGVVRCPDPPIIALGKAENREPHERRPFKVKPVYSIQLKNGFEEKLLTLAGQPCPILIDKGQPNVSINLLNRFPRYLPIKACSENRVSLDDAFPRLSEGRDIESFADRAGELLNVHARPRRGQTVNEHGVLNGRKRI
jgi:hypothetical protein